MNKKKDRINAPRMFDELGAYILIMVVHWFGWVIILIPTISYFNLEDSYDYKIVGIILSFISTYLWISRK